MTTLEDLKVSPYEISLAKLIGKKINDVRGRITTDSAGELVFKLLYIELENGELLGCEGEHDFPYLVNWPDKQRNLDSDVLNQLLNSGILI